MFGVILKEAFSRDFLSLSGLTNMRGGYSVCDYITEENEGCQVNIDKMHHHCYSVTSLHE